MFLLRRAAARAVALPPTRQLSTLRPTTRLPLFAPATKPTLYRPFHQTRIWRAEEAARDEVAESEEGAVPPEIAAELAEEAAEVESVAANATPDVAEPFSNTTTSEEHVDPPDVAAAAAASEQVIADAASTAAQSAPRPPPQGRDSTSFGNASPNPTLYCGNLFFDVTAAQLEAEFQKFGQVTSARIVTDSRGLSKGFGYIDFASQEAADRAVRELDQKVFQGRRMAVQYHVQRERRRFNAERPSSPNQPSKTLFIGNMSYQMSDRDLNDLFREIRDVLDVRVAIDRRSGQPRGFAHADFIDIASAEKAKDLLEKKVVYGRQLRVDFSTDAAQRKPA